MQKYRAAFLISTLWMLSLAVAAGDESRTKRQAPNINVHQIPKTSFTCSDKKVGEYYADPEANCQVYHVCIPGAHNKMSLMSFVCPNGTIFSQATRVCTPYERVDCSLTYKFYESLHGDPNSRRTDYDAESDIDNYVSQPPPREQPPPRQPPPSRSRNTPAPPPPAPPAPQPPRTTRFRSGSNQFRGQQAPPVTTPAPARVTVPPQPARNPLSPVRPAAPAFRAPILPARGQAGGTLANVIPPRPTARATVSTSTSSYNYEYEYEYDYEDETPEQGSTRTKRDVSEDAEDRNLNLEKRQPFTCEDKMSAGVYADVDSGCEMFHICIPFGKYKMLDYKVYCANGTGFDQETGSCREKSEFVCENTHLFFQFDKAHQPTSGKKPVFKKAKYITSKKVSRTKKE